VATAGRCRWAAAGERLRLRLNERRGVAAALDAELMPRCVRAVPDRLACSGAPLLIPSLCYRLFQFLGHLPKTSAGPQSNHYYSEESGNRLIQPTTDPGQMNKQQTAAALQLVALLEGDLEGQANCSLYGNWLEHLTDHLADEHVEQLTFSCKQLHPVC